MNSSLIKLVKLGARGGGGQTMAEGINSEEMDGYKRSRHKLPL